MKTIKITPYTGYTKTDDLLTTYHSTYNEVADRLMELMRKRIKMYGVECAITDRDTNYKNVMYLSKTQIPIQILYFESFE